MRKQTVYNRIITDFSQYWKTIVWFAIVFFLSTMKVPDVPRIPLIDIPHFDKIIHFLMYFILATIWMIDDYKKRKLFRTLNLIITFASAVLYGALLELVQKIIVQNRSGDILDVFANMMGAIFALILFRNISLYRKLLVNIFAFGYKEVKV